MELFAKTVNGFQVLTTFAKGSTLDGRLGSEYAGVKIGLIVIRRNFIPYTISRKGRNDWARGARNIFNFTAPLNAENRHVNQNTIQKRSL